ncbi:M14 family metallopeptidase [Muricauda sp. SCSIO 64092]|uniref:M14 family metallopeptidase n=1 Tax=Allomuricauda sp. SCSIO 64092 TaxID=2908842 RepID=UPI001FF1139A|nr:M14 family metallopeptidase [Muricauda sp. SCSIO 64092]UOY07447.1 M14 family metallopeptidase [Muricauda sp. SCSIO 64092]
MKSRYLVFLLIPFLFSCKDSIQPDEKTFSTIFEDSNGMQTATYDQVIEFYLLLAREFPEINVQTIGDTDSGHPLHLVTYNPNADFNFQKIRQEKSIVLINNGIHPGEPDGIDATMLLFRNLAQKRIDAPENVVITSIPVYNVGGMLNRNSTSRVNQNGPETYGFRGNAQNYDLNRDFIKMDTRNAYTFVDIFHLLKPDIFIDNHVSNGADYQYILTHLFTQHNKLGGELGNYLHQELMPSLEMELQNNGLAITPYVNVFNRPPDGGFSQFMDHPRYSTGYTTLWSTLGMMVETHMLKPYKLRVESTYELLRQMVDITDRDYEKIKSLRTKANESALKLKGFPLNWVLDTTKVTKLNFKGFTADTLLSELTGMPRLRYDKTKPFEKEIPYHDHFYPKDTIEVPEAYLLKKGWQKVIDRLAANNIDYFEVEKDTLLSVESYHIKSYETYSRPYEGHYPHYNTQVTKSQIEVRVQKGDYVIPTRQEGIRYVLETLEPEAVDSFFNWNFFDTVLQQKEGFSPYVFEDLALRILGENVLLKDSFELKKAKEKDFSENWYAQLAWIYKNSQHGESAHLQYPVYRILKGSEGALLLKD